VRQLARPLAFALLAGTALLGAAAAFHPMLAGDAAAQLRLIADTSYWRTVHLVMLVGSALVIVGLWARVPLDATGASAPMLAALGTIAIGIAVNALDIAFMAGAGWHMAAMFRDGQTEMMSTLFAVTHPIGRMFARFGNLIVALGAAFLGWLEWHDAETPRWVAALAWLAALGGLVGVLFFDEASPAVLAAVALLSAWQVATALRALNVLRSPAVASAGTGR